MSQVCVAVIGGSRGIGRAVAQHYGAAGLPVVVASRTEPSPDLSAAWIRADLTRAEDMTPVASWLADQEPGRMVVVTAASFGPVGPITSIDTDRWNQTLTLNVLGAAIALRALLPVLDTQDRMVFLLGGGVGGPRLQPRATAYTTSKIALAGLIEAVARDEMTLTPVIGLSPGSFPTGFTDEALSADPALAGNELLAQVRTNQAADFDITRLVAALDFIMTAEGASLAGRMVAAQRDDLAVVAAAARGSEDALRLRRVDGESIIARSAW